MVVGDWEPEAGSPSRQRAGLGLSGLGLPDSGPASAAGPASNPRVASPSLRFERALWATGLRRIVGIDEAGIGSLCGPVVAAAVCVVPVGRVIDGVRDSKLLSSPQREALYLEILSGSDAVGIGAASVDEIERLNVRSASHLAMKRALARIGAYDHALIDGRPIKRRDLGPHTTIVDGDALSYSIACASIVAKVTRDRLMKRLAARFPAYGWDHNAGYGTSEHLVALGRCGLTPYHRRGYGPVRALLSQDDEGLDGGPTESGS